MAPEEADEFGTSITCENETKSREKRFSQQLETCERINYYLRHGKHLDGLTKNQQRVVRGEAKNYFIDEASKVYYIFCYVLLYRCFSLNGHHATCLNRLINTLQIIFLKIDISNLSTFDKQVL